ncbi:hypothetical protein EG328_003554 [Venturia inaequalis]|uniref:Cytidyltransferase-like domain-containing protein n=1 Tax=Venturia inaequalis TaxID=5025 RepID=A0A8H3USW0_VENIN|nr:hypothetical protein EG328_003554 [Venturia inaequalis]
MTSSIVLEDYLLDAYYETRPVQPRSFFRTPSTSPRLKQGVTNRILVFRGCFNPPHIAHLNLLRYVYLRAASEFNIVAALIVALPDYSCTIKFQDPTDESLLFSWEERKTLWEQDSQFPDWACVIELDKWSNWVKPGLLTETIKDGFEVKFVHVLGPDHIAHKEGYDYVGETMTSDTGRRANFVGLEGMLDLPNCSPWAPWESRSLRLRKSKKERFMIRTGVFGGINGKSIEYLKGCVMGVLQKVVAGRTAHFGRGYRDAQTHLTVPNPVIHEITTTGEGLRKSCSTKEVKTETKAKTKTPKKAKKMRKRKDIGEVEEVTDEGSPVLQYCRGTQETDDLFFIPTAENSEYRKNTSSTEIRTVMEKNTRNPKDITEELASLVLGPHRKVSFECEESTGGGLPLM